MLSKGKPPSRVGTESVLDHPCPGGFFPTCLWHGGWVRRRTVCPVFGGIPIEVEDRKDGHWWGKVVRGPGLWSPQSVSKCRSNRG